MNKDIKILLVTVVIIAGIIISVLLYMGSTTTDLAAPPCVGLADVFVDLDRDGDDDLLIDGCAIFNRGQVDEVKGPADLYGGLVPTPEIFPSGE